MFSISRKKNFILFWIDKKNALLLYSFIVLRKFSFEYT